MRTNSAMAASSFPCRISFSAFRSVTARSMGKAIFSLRSRSLLVVLDVSKRHDLGGRRPVVHRIKQRWRPERAAMHLRVAESCHGLEMIGGGVALVAIEAVARI